MLIRNATVVHHDRLLKNCDLRIENGKITQIGGALGGKSDPLQIEAHEMLLLPGLIDLHTHGLGDFSVQENGLREYAALQLEQGVTGCVGTIAGTPEENIRCIKRCLAETNNLADTPNVYGFRPEIMYVSKSGAGSPGSLRPIEASITQSIYEAAGGRIAIWDVSPELEGATAFIRWAVKRGIVVSMAHTRAGIEEARTAVDAGLSLVTHLYDTFDPPDQKDGGVYPAGITDYIQVEDRLTVEIIPDGVHVHPLLVEMTLRCKGIEHVCFITDSLRGAGKSSGIYDGLAPGQSVRVTENRGMRRVSDDALCGSTLTQLQSLRNAVRVFGKTAAEASALCSRIPARVLGLDSKGIIDTGMDADLILLDAELQLEYTILGGQIVYSRADL